MRWQNSQCLGNLYHDYQIRKTTTEGVVEICTRCKDKQFFNNKVPNGRYLSFHIRSLLQKRDPRFIREYQNNAATTASTF